MSFYEIKINDFDDILKLNFPEYWVFRGQNKDWNLKTSIERMSNNLEDLLSKESCCYEYFKKATGINSKLECLALMQHYGLPTRLLDFTKSLLIALYFAANDCDKYDGVIWAVNLIELYRCQVLDGKVKNVNSRDSDDVKCVYSKENITEKGMRSSLVFSVDLFDKHLTKNKRYINQQCKFLIYQENSPLFPEIRIGRFQNSLYDSFNIKESKYLESSKNLEIDFFKNTKVIKFLIPKENKKDLFNNLDKYNINENFLFPKEEDSKIQKICSEIKRDCSYMNWIK